jgi:hypothetical protein
MKLNIFKKKKNKYPEKAKYQKGDYVNFRYRDDLCFGYIWDAIENIDKKIIYEIQIGGQCPAIVKNIEENIIIGYKKD